MKDERLLSVKGHLLFKKYKYAGSLPENLLLVF